MTWQDQPIPNDDEGRPMFKGLMSLTNDNGDKLGGICWFFDTGPFYSNALDVKELNTIRRIGPYSTLEGAKQSVIDAIEGKLDISGRAGYPR